jgi:hypothetical protein
MPGMTLIGKLPFTRAKRSVAEFCRNSGGAIVVEFAYTFPVVLALGMYGVDVANLALTNLKLNQIALNLADNSSRTGGSAGGSKQQMRVIDVVDVFEAAKIQGASINLEANSRITLTSLEKDSTGTQRIHWQRCFGQRTDESYKSHYGRVANTDGNAETTTVVANYQYRGVAAASGIGDTGSKVNAPVNDSGVMFVEINYRYTPIFSWVSSPADLRFVASYIVRDARDFSQLFNSTGSNLHLCGYSRTAP